MHNENDMNELKDFTIAHITRHAAFKKFCRVKNVS